MKHTLNKKATISILAISLLMFGISFIDFTPELVDSGINSESTITYSSDVCIEVDRANGDYEDYGCGHNILYTTGKNLVKTYLGDTGGGTDEIDQIALCNATLGCGAPAVGAGETYNEYTNCGLAKATGTYTSNSDGNWSIAKTFTSTCDGVVTNVTRIGNTAGTWFAGNSFTSVTLQENDQVTITWTKTVA